MPKRKPRPLVADACPCWVISPGSKTLRQCNLLDVSDQGAKIVSETALPETFYLLLALDHQRGRRCHVVSRAGHEFKVEFLGGDENSPAT